MQHIPGNGKRSAVAAFGIVPPGLDQHPAFVRDARRIWAVRPGLDAGNCRFDYPGDLLHILSQSDRPADAAIAVLRADREGDSGEFSKNFCCRKDIFSVL